MKRGRRLRSCRRRKNSSGAQSSQRAQRNWSASMRMKWPVGLACWAVFCGAIRADDAGTRGGIRVQQTPAAIQIDTDLLQARINKTGYVSGVAQGSFLDKKTGAREAGFGLHIMDFLMAPGWRDDGYLRDAKIHGDLPKHYVEGPQICTQAKELKSEVVKGQDFVAVKLRFTFTQPGKGYRAGSTWEQTLVFLPGVR